MLTMLKFKTFLNIDPADASKDVILQDCIDEAIAEMDSLTNRTLEYKTYKIYLSGSGSSRLRLTAYPIIAITKLQYFDGTNWTDILNAPDLFADSLIIDGQFIQFIKNYTFPYSKYCNFLDIGNNYFLGYGGLGMSKSDYTKNIYIEFDAGYASADDWITAHVYNPGDLTLYNDVLYTCAIANSDAAFTIGKWTVNTAPAVPKDLQKAVKYLAAKEFQESPAGGQWFMKQSQNIGGQSSSGSSKEDMEKWLKNNIDRTANAYRRVNI